MSQATPAIPASVPNSLSPLSFSSAVRTCAARTVKSGVAAMRIEARPPGRRVWPQVISAKGRALLPKPRTTSAAIALPLPGKRDAEERRARPEEGRREADARRHQRQRRELPNGDADEEVRSTPQQGKQGPKVPIRARSSGVCGSRQLNSPAGVRTGVYALSMRAVAEQPDRPAAVRRSGFLRRHAARREGEERPRERRL